jgi:NAD(P)-dependent dehydrogenase (short-subunit alcohol dehydrogenase family)
MTELRGLAGKTVLVTGGSKGQGFSHVKGFARAGCDVAVLDITEPIRDIYPLADAQMLIDTVKAVEQLDQRCIALPCDVRVESQVEARVAEAKEFFGKSFDIVVNNAGVAALDPIHQMRSHVLDAVIDTIVKGTMYVTKHTVGDMIERRSGKIINITSAVVGDGIGHLSHYVGAKWAVVGLTKAWAYELSEFNINVNAISPATIRPGRGQGSGMVAGLATFMEISDDEAYEQFSGAANFVGDHWRVEVQHITDGVLFLASDNADMITAEVLAIDAGQTSN